MADWRRIYRVSTSHHLPILEGEAISLHVSSEHDPFKNLHVLKRTSTSHLHETISEDGAFMEDCLMDIMSTCGLFAFLIPRSSFTSTAVGKNFTFLSKNDTKSY